MKNNFKEVRKRNLMTQQQLAEKLHISKETYRNYESGRSQPSFEVLIEISKICNTSVDELLGIKNDNYITLTKENYQKLIKAIKLLTEIIENN